LYAHSRPFRASERTDPARQLRCHLARARRLRAIRHERGSFTGAIAQRSGWFERADGGTLFLDEVAELPLAAQVRLLRVVQDGVFERVGGVRSLRVDVRVIAATHRDLSTLVERGAFRQDLWYRINVFTIRRPALRERQGDIAALAEHFAAREARRLGAAPPTLSEADLALLRTYHWPGNVRELGAVIERAAILGEAGKLDIARALGISGTEGLAFPSLGAAIKRHIERALEQCRGRIDGPRGAARLLGVNPNTLRSKMQKLGVRVDAFRPNFD
jgi:DNA-binding NtrC family response regulator